MIEEHHGFDRVVILSDESANWQIAGLRQLDRLVLGLDEFAKAMGTANKIEIVVFWKPEIPLSERLLPKHQRITRVRLTEASGSIEPEARILATRLFIARNALSKFFSTTPPVKIEQPIVDLTGAWPRLFEQFERTCRSATRAEEEDWRFLAQPSEIVATEKHLLRHIGKSQDGMVSKFLNRPISRVITRLLLKLPITPNAWTILIFALAPVAFVFLVRGDYTGFLAGTALFQLINILDGCDGEIARAKYLDSERGRRLDAFCDFVANLIFVLCLGIGLFRQPSVSANIRLRLSARELDHVLYNGGRGWPFSHAASRSRYHARSLAPAGRLQPGRSFFRSRADRFHLSNHPARRDLFCVSPFGDRRSRVMDSAHCFRLFRDHAALQAVQEELAAGRGNTLIMAVDDDRVYPRDALETYLYYSELLPGRTLFSRCVWLDTN